MNIFFLSFDVEKCAWLYCDQHVGKILLEIVQMLYTAQHILGNTQLVEKKAPLKVDKTQRGYKKVSNPKHAMVMWVRSHKNNYLFAADLGIALALEFYKRFGKVHSCSRHVYWLKNNPPNNFFLVENEKSYYAETDVPEYLTRIPECMDSKYHDKSILVAYRRYYEEDKVRFARWKRRDEPYH